MIFFQILKGRIMNIIEFYMTNKHLWEVFSEMILLPKFTEQELERWKAEYLAKGD
jgi:hypothetical protein